jgi:hypothetical protein
VEARPYDARRVDDENVARRNERREIVEVQMADLAARAIEHQQSTRSSLG